MHSKFIQGLMHKEYLFHLYDLFKDYCITPPKISDLKPDKRTNKVYSNVSFQTIQLPCFNEFPVLFYYKGNKVIPLVTY